MKEEGDEHRNRSSNLFWWSALDEILRPKPEMGIKYQLSVEGSLLPFDWSD